MPVGTRSNDPIEVFYSYAHEDEKLRDKLSNHLRILARQGVIEDWWDRRITAGEDFADRIDEHLERAQVILLLISADFIASDYAYKIEMKRALERHQAGDARLIVVLLRPVLYEDSPFSGLKILPLDARPVTKWPNADEAFANVAAGIKAVVQELRPQANFGLAAAVPMRETEASAVRALPKAWNVPYARNPDFVGRDDTLRGLHEGFASGPSPTLIQVIHGPPGSGKTSVAVEYAYRYASDYRVIWWMRAGQETSLAFDYAGLAWRVGLPERVWPSQDAMVAAVRRWLADRSDWLIVFDNVARQSDLNNFLPPNAKGHILVTSRIAEWDPTANVSTLSGLGSADAIEFLEKRTGLKDVSAAESLATELRGLPLALEQAAAYISATPDGSVASYATELAAARTQLDKDEPTSDERRPPEHAQWELSFGRIRAEAQSAADLLTLSAFLAPEDIPVSLLVAHVEVLPESLATTLSDTQVTEKVVELLRRYALVRSAGDALFVHRRAQAMATEGLGSTERRGWTESAVKLVAAAFPRDAEDVRSWPACSRLLPHAVIAAKHAEELDVAPETTARLLSAMALFLNARAQFQEAKSVIDRALALDQRALGPNHPAVARDRNHRGRILRSLGYLADAEVEYERACAIDESTFGPRHPNVATHLSGLGRVLLESGDAAAAKDVHERALSIDEAVYPQNDASIARDLVMLGRVLHEMGDVKRAVALHTEAIAKDQMIYGENHPEVATDLVDLGRALIEQGEYAKAKSHLERALAIDEAVYGSSHPTVARCLAELGRVERLQGNYGKARSALEQALDIDERAHGLSHPFVARDLTYLVELLVDVRDSALAAILSRRAIGILEASKGRDHPDAIRARAVLDGLDVAALSET